MFKKIKISKAHRAAVTKMAWAILRKVGMSFGQAMKQAWASIRTKLQLENTDEKGRWIQFEKADGTSRYALATRTLKYIPLDQHPFGLKPETNPLVVIFYDLLASDWRSFRADRLILS